MKHDIHSKQPLIVATQLKKQFRAEKGAVTHALRGIDITIHANEFVAIVGSSGSGKSTLLYCLSGLEAATEGEIKLVGETLRGTPTVTLSDNQSSSIGFVFQNYQLLPFLSVSENALLPAKYAHKTEEALTRLPEILERLGLSEKANQPVAGLSGGQQQRVAIARALVNEPRLIFADEPTGALDSTNAREVVTILSTIPNANRSVVMVTHDLEVASHADRILLLSDGKIVREMPRSNAGEILAALRSVTHKKV